MIFTSYLFYWNLLAHRGRTGRKHALLPDSLKFAAQHINSSSERQWIYGKKQACEEKLMRGWHASVLVYSA